MWNIMTDDNMTVQIPMTLADMILTWSFWNIFWPVRINHGILQHSKKKFKHEIIYHHKTTNMIYFENITDI